MQGFFHLSTVQKDRPGSISVPRCGSCGLYKSCLSPKMKPFGEGAKRVLVVGEAPGETEDKRGRPFIGKAGNYLRDALEGLGIDLDEDAVTTNALICRPPGNKIPDLKCVEYCHPNLTETIRRFKPRVILTLGRSALVGVLRDYWKGDDGTLERWIGWKIPLADFWLCPTWHPSYLMRMNSQLMDRQFREHLAAAFEIQRDPRPVEKARIQKEYDPERIGVMLREMDQDGAWVAFDYETNCLKPEYPKAEIKSCAVSDGETTLAYPWSPAVADATGSFLRSPRTRKIASNLKFEDRWTRKKLGHRVRGWGWDTMIAAHCLDNRRGICSLKFLSFVHLGIPTYNEHIEPYLESHRGPYNRINEIELDDLLYYNGMDAILEYRIAMMQRKEMGYED